MKDEAMSKFAIALRDEFEDHPPFEDCLTPSDFMTLWRYLRMYPRRTITSLLTWAEILSSTKDPLTHFTEAMEMFLTEWHETGRGLSETEDRPEETPGALH